MTVGLAGRRVLSVALPAHYIYIKKYQSSSTSKRSFRQCILVVVRRWERILSPLSGRFKSEVWLRLWLTVLNAVVFTERSCRTNRYRGSFLTLMLSVEH